MRLLSLESTVTAYELWLGCNDAPEDTIDDHQLRLIKALAVLHNQFSQSKETLIRWRVLQLFKQLAHSICPLIFSRHCLDTGN